MLLERRAASRWHDAPDAERRSRNAVGDARIASSQISTSRETFRRASSSATVSRNVKTLVQGIITMNAATLRRHGASRGRAFAAKAARVETTGANRRWLRAASSRHEHGAEHDRRSDHLDRMRFQA